MPSDSAEPAAAARAMIPYCRLLMLFSAMAPAHTASAFAASSSPRILLPPNAFSVFIPCRSSSYSAASGR
jgi:hypothetical protein